MTAYPTLIDCLRERAAVQADHTAYVFLADGETEQARLSYADLDRRATAIAARLGTLCGRGERVLLLYPQGLEFIAAFFGCLYAGMIAVPAYPPRAGRIDARLAAIATDARPAVVLTLDSLCGVRERLAADDPLAALPWLAGDTLPLSPVTLPLPPVEPSALAFLQYTSGSTATPRGVMVSHDNLCHNLLDLDRGWEHDADSVMVSWLPAFHDMGLIYGILMPLYRGFPCYLMAPAAFLARPLRWLEALSRYRGTHSAAPDFAYALCAERGCPPGLDLSAWRVALNAAEPVRARTLAQFCRVFAPAGFDPRTFCPGFGLAEVTLKVTALPAATPYTVLGLDSTALARRQVKAVTEQDYTLVGCGSGQVDSRVLIVDPATHLPCATDEVGEIWVAGRSVAQGYWQRPEATETVFRAHTADGDGPFLRTGDLGFVYAGELYIAGRLKDTIILRGLNYYPQDIEACVQRSHADLKADAGAAFALTDETGEQLVVVQEVRRDALKRLDAPAVAAAIRRQLAEELQLQPAAIVLLRPATLPKTSSGKIQRSAARAAFMQGELAAVADFRAEPAGAPTTQAAVALDRWLCDWLGARLELSAIDPQRPLAEYGLDSALAVELAVALGGRLERTVAATLVWEYPTVAALAAYFSAPPPASADLEQQLRRLQAENAALRRHAQGWHEPIAVVGLGCRFPAAANPQAFWELLCAGIDAITETPPERWSNLDWYDPDPDAPGKLYTRYGGFLADVAGFDAAFFGISPREAISLDPQQRLLLEVCWEALEQANLPADRLRGTATGLFVGLCFDDYARLTTHAADPTRHDALASLGNARSVAAGRVAYTLGLQGPVLALDTACSSSALAVHLAMQSLRAGDCSLALAGGVNLLLAPQTSVGLSRLRALAADGRCRTFDAQASGYGRGEGCGIVVLKRLEDALAAGDNVLAVLAGSAVNHDGTSNGLTAPNGQAQTALLRQALTQAGWTADSVQYVETHGTGTVLGDPIEVNALARALGDGRTEPLLLGAVKTNIGHLEAAAGVAGLIKTVLSLHHRTLPASLHFAQPNPHIDWARLPLKVVTQTRPWPTAAVRRAGVSAFGLSGTNVHLLVEAAPPVAAVSQPARPRQLLPLSARSPAALAALATAYAARLTATDTDPAALCFTAATGRSVLDYRAAVTGASADELRAALAAVHVTEPAGAAQTAFLFTGQGAQQPGMGRALYQTEPVFRDLLDRCAALLDKELPRPLLAVLYGDNPDLIHQTAYAQPALFAVEAGLCALWRSWGVEPAAVMGHSLGEYVAAWAAGVFSLEDGLKLVAARGRLMQALPAGGAMAAVRAEAATLMPWLADYPALALAAVNGPMDSVISGEARALAQLLSTLATVGIESRPLTVSHAFHSPLLEPMLAEFRAVAAGITYQPPRLPLISNLTGAPLTAVTADYWVQHARQPVQFAVGIESLAQQGCTVFLELGPQPVLLGLGRRCLPGQSGLHWLPSLTTQDTWTPLLDSLAALYRQGVAVDWTGFYRHWPQQRVDLPTYPFQRRRYWLDTPDRDNLPGLYTLHWSAIAPAATAAPTPAQLRERLGEIHEPALTAYSSGLAALEDLSLDYVLAALARLGWQPHAGATVNAADLAGQLGIAERHRRLLGRLLAMLGEAGLLQAAGTGWTVVQGLPPVTPAVQAQHLRTQHPVLAAELELVSRCGTQLAAVLRGDVEPLDLLFPGGDTDLLTQLYGASPGAQVMNDLVARVAAAASAGRPLRVLEIGAGTGATAARVLAALPHEVEYWFTDLSLLFLHRARSRFGDRPGLRTHLLDLERPPQEQGLDGQAFDLIIAANVLHACRDLRQALAHTHHLLAAGGLLVLLESTERRRWLDITFGLTDGWWRCTDADLRPDHPLLAVPTWQRVLAETGFTASTALLPVAPPVFQQAVLVAQRGELPQAHTGHWLIFADAAGLGRQLAERLGAAHCTLITATDPTPEPTGADAFAQLLDRLPTPLAGVVHLWALDPVTDDLDAYTTHTCASALHLSQALLERDLPGGLWLVTRGARAVAAEQRLHPEQSPLWGLGRTLQLEHPELACHLLDLDPAGQADEADTLAVLLRQAPADAELAQRGNTCYQPQIKALPIAATPSLYCDATASYLIVGGLGGLGLATARWLAERGARALVLLGRRAAQEPPPPVVLELLAAGVRVERVSGDAASRADLARALAVAQTLGPLKGVIHSAGVFADRRLAEHRWDLFRTVFAPKVLGAWHLHQLTRDIPLDFFVLFSSAASLLGAAGLANYVAANAYLDTLAHARRRQGLPALTVNWGPWAATGMADAVSDLRRSQWAQAGIEPFSPAAALAALERLLHSDVAQAGVLNIDWQRYNARSGAALAAASVATGMAATVPAPPTVATAVALPDDFAVRWPSTPPGQRRQVLQTWLRTLLATTLGFDSPQAVPVEQGFFQLGLDSLTAMELHRRLQAGLGRTLPPTLSFKYPTVAALTDYLLAELCPADPAPVAGHAAEPTAGDVQDLAAELAELEQLLGGASS